MPTPRYFRLYHQDLHKIVFKKENSAKNYILMYTRVSVNMYFKPKKKILGWLFVCVCTFGQKLKMAADQTNRPMMTKRKVES